MIDCSFITESFKKQKDLAVGWLRVKGAGTKMKMNVYIAAQLFWRLRFLFQSFIRKKAVFIEALSFVIFWDLYALVLCVFYGKKKSINPLTISLLFKFSNPEQSQSPLTKVQLLIRGTSGKMFVCW